MKNNQKIIKRNIAWIILAVMGVNCFGSQVPAGGSVQAAEYSGGLDEAAEAEASGSKDIEEQEALEDAVLPERESVQEEADAVLESEAGAPAVHAELEETVYEAKTISSDTALTEDMEVGDLTVNNVLRLNGHKLVVHGSLYLNNTLFMQEGYLEVRGNLTEGISGALVINSHNDYVVINGDYGYCDGTDSGTQTMTNGTLEICGNIYQAADCTYGRKIYDDSCKVILQSGKAQSISLSPTGKVQIKHLIIHNSSEEGVFSEHALDCEILEDPEKQLYFAVGGSTGEVLAEDQTIEGDYTLLAGELDLAGHILTVKGNFIHAGGRIHVNGGSLIINGDYQKQYPYEKGEEQITEQSPGRLIMDKEQDYVLVEGDYADSGIHSTENDLTAGVLELKGSIRAEDALSHPLLYTGKNHTLKLTGDGVQTISRGKRYSGSYVQLANLLVSQGNTGSVVLEETIQVDGSLRHETGSITGKTRLGSSAKPSGRLYGEIELVKDLRIEADCVFTGNVSAPFSGTLTAKNSHVTIEGDYRQTGGTLVASGENALITILGNYIINGASVHKISSGKIELKGDMIRENGYLTADKNAELIFSGTRKQQIQLAHESTQLNNIIVDNPEGVVVADNVSILNVTCRQGVLSYASGGVHGFTVEEDGEYDGDLVIAGGVLDLNGHSYHVKGSLTIKNGVLNMTDEQDYLLVDGDFETTSKMDHYGKLTAGMMELKGDFVQKGNRRSFTANGQHTICFSGDQVQNVTFESSRYSCFSNIKLENKEKIVFAEFVWVQGVVEQNCPAEGRLGICNTTVFMDNTYKGNVLVVGDTDLKNNLYIDGDFDIDRFVRLQLGKYKLEVSGTVGMDSAYLYFFEGSLVCANLKVEACHGFFMQDSASRLEVKGDAYFQNDNSNSKFLNAGTIIVGGDLTFLSGRYGSTFYNWRMDDTVKVILNGSEKQIVTMDNASHILGTLTLENTSEEGIFVTDYLTYREMDNTAGVKVNFADGGILGYVLKEDTIIDGDLLLSGGEMDLNGYTLTVRGALVQAAGSIRVNGGCLEVEGDYCIAKRTEEKDGTYTYSSTGAGLVMQEDKERVILHKNFYTAFADKCGISCLAGTIELKGNLNVLSGQYSMGEKSTMLFSGSGQQEISNKGSGISFGGLTITNVVGLSGKDSLSICGKLQTNGYPVDCTLCCQSGAFLLDESICADLNFKDSMDLSRDVYVKGNVTLGKLRLNAHHLTVEGNCSLNDSDIVQADGILEIKGNIIRNGKYSGAGTNQVILSGETKQTIANSGMGLSFQELIVANTSDAGVYSEGLFDAETVIDPENKLSFYTEGEAGYVLTRDTVIAGDFTQLLGTMDLNGYTLTVIGDYIQRNGSVKVNGGEFKVYGDYTLGNLNERGGYVFNHAKLVMEEKKELVFIGGDLKLASGVSMDSYTKSGTIEVKGDVFCEDTLNVCQSKDLTICFSGDEVQYVTRNSFGNIQFGTIRLANTSEKGVVFNGNTVIQYPVMGNGRMNCGNWTLYWQNGQSFPFTEYEGNVCLRSVTVLNQDLNIKGIFTIEGTLDVNGYHLTADSLLLRNMLKVNGGVIQVYNNVEIDNYASHLRMSGEQDIVQVAGDVTAHYGKLTLSAGTLEVKGNLSINGASVTAEEKHNTILSGKMTGRGIAYVQTVTLETSTRLGTLTLTKPRDYYVFNRDVEGMCQNLIEDIQDITAPTAPAGLRAIDVSYTKLTLSWEASTDDTGVAGYDVYRNDKKIMTVSGTSYTDRRLNPDTEYSYYVTAKDATLNTSALSKTVTVTTLKDEEAPEIPQGVELKERFGTALSIGWQPSKDNVGTKGYHIYRNGELIKDVRDTNYTDTGLEENSSYTYQFAAYDEAGNESERSKEYSFYTQTVEIAEISPEAYAKLSGKEADVTIRFQNAGSANGYQVYMGYRETKEAEYQELYQKTVGKNTAYRQLLTASAVLDTTQIQGEELQLLVRITDGAGNETEEVYTYYLDRSAPAKLKEVGAEVRNGVAVISFDKGKEADIAGYRIYRQQTGQDMELFLDSSNKEKTYYYDTTIEEGVEYTYYVTAYDKDGLESVLSDGAVITGNADEEEPRIESVSPLDGTLTGKVKLTVHATDNKELDCLVIERYEKSSEENTELARLPIVGGTAVYELDTTTWEAEAVLEFTVYDKAGNCNGNEFICTYEIDNEGPGEPEGLTADVRSTTVILSWDRPEDADYAYALVEQLAGDGTAKEVTRTTTVTGCVIEGLAPEQTVQYQVTFYDQCGNRGKTSKPLSVTAGADTVAPRILSVSPNGGYFNSRIPIQVQAYDNAALAKIIVEYSYDKTTWELLYTESSETPAKEFTIHYDMDTADMREGEVYVRAYAVDTAGNEGDKEQVLIQYITDRTAPAAVDKLTAEGEAGSIHLKWNEPVDNDVACYRLYRSAEGLNAYRCIAASIQTKDYYDRSAAYDTSYSYRLTVLDFAGNESAYSNVAVGQKFPDDEAPKVHSLVPEEDAWISGTVKLSAYVSDNDRVTSVEFAVKSMTEGGTKLVIDTVEADISGGTVSCELDTTQYANGVYQILATAKDAAGNTGTRSVDTCHICNVTMPAPQLFAAAGDWCVELHYTAEPDVSYVLYRKNKQTEDEFRAVASGSGNLSYRDNDVHPRYEYAYQLMIQDKAGNCAYSAVSYVKPRAVDNQKPVAVIETDTSVVEGYEVVLNGMESTDNDRIVRYTWDFGDGTEGAEGPYPVHTYRKEGTYLVKLTVEDASGNVSDTAVNINVLKKEDSGRAVVEVRNAAGSPLKNVTVYVNTSSERNDTFYTDKNGQAVVMQRAGTYRIALYKPGYVAVEKEVEIELHGERQYVFTLDEGETLTADFTVRQMNFDEIVAAGIDLSDPANQHVFTVQTKLSFMDAERHPEYEETVPLQPAKTVVSKGKSSSSSDSSGGDGGPGNGGGGGGGSSEPETEGAGLDFYYTIRINQSISWLKDMYEATLIVYNNAGSQTIVARDLAATLQLPYGLNLAGTRQGQSQTQTLPDLKGGESGSVAWYVRGDTAGNYRLHALLTGTLQPFNADITCQFESNEFEVTAGDGLVLTIHPEDRAEKNEQYYVYFILSNEGSKEFYNVKTTFGTQHNNSKRYVAAADGSKRAPVMSAGDMAAVDCLKPGESISGIYKTAIPVDGDKWFDYKSLLDYECKILAGANLGVSVRISPVASHVPVPDLTYQAATDENSEADPVNVSTGAYTDQINALSVQGVNPVSADLQYDSTAVEELGEFGYGWTHNYEARILDMKDCTVRYYVSPTGYYTFLAEDYEKAEYKQDADGYLYLDEKSIPTRQNYKCLNENKAEYVLKRNDSGAFTLTDAAGTTTKFDKDGNLTSIRNKDGRKLTFTRSKTQFTVTDAVSGRKLTYTLNKDKLVEKVKDSSGREALFYYDENQCLKQFTNALGENTYYTYDKAHRILTVTDDDNNTYVTNTYKEYASVNAVSGKAVRVASQKDGLGNKTTFSYKEDVASGDLVTTVTTRSGKTKKTVTDAYGNITCQTNEAGHETQMTYDGDGNQKSINNANGYSTVYKYENGNMTRIENSLMDGSKAETVMTYDNGNMVTMENASGESMRCTYYDNGLIKSVTDQNKNTVEYQYNENGQVTEEKDSGGKTVEYEYNAKGDLIKVKDKNDHYTEYTYNKAGLQEKVTVKDGEQVYTTQTFYDDLGRVDYTIDTEGGVTAYEYDCAGNVTSRTDPGGAMTVYQYDANYQLVEETVYTGEDEETVSSSTAYAYTKEGLLKKVTDGESGTVIQNTYDAVGNKTKEVEKDKDGKKLSETLYEYDEAGNVTKQTQVNVNPKAGEPESLSVQYRYYPNGKLNYMIDASGVHTTYGYDKSWRVNKIKSWRGGLIKSRTEPTITYEYDAAGRVRTETTGEEEAKEEEKTVTTYAYDIYGNVTEATDPRGNKTLYRYDGNGNLLETEDCTGRVFYSRYDALNRVVETGIREPGKNASANIPLAYTTYDIKNHTVTETDAVNGGKLITTYDSAGRPVKTTNGEGAVLSETIYDTEGRILQTVDAKGMLTENVYNSFGQIETVKTGKKGSAGKGGLYAFIGEVRETVYAYDALGRNTQVTDAEQGVSSVVFDGLGRVASLKDPNQNAKNGADSGNTYTYTYNEQGLLEVEENAIENKVQYKYNSALLLAQMTDSADETTSYTYDSLNRLKTVEDGLGTIKYTYDANGNITEVSEEENGIRKLFKEPPTIRREFDSLNRVTTYTDYAGREVRYGYDALGNMTELTYPGGEIVRYDYHADGSVKSMSSNSGGTFIYGYDNYGRLCNITRADGSTEIREYDPAGQLTKQTDLDKDGKILQEHFYTYDVFGEVVEKKTTNTQNPDVLKTVSMTYDDANRLDTYNGQKVTYDEKGNMTKGPVDGKMQELTYDCRNRLVEAGGVRYTYDAENTRIATIEGELTTEYVTDTGGSLSRLLVAYEADNTQTTYYYGADGLAAQYNSGTKKYFAYHYDNIGSTTLITAKDGHAVERFSYGTYGELLKDPITKIRFLYNGSYGVTTDENGLYYMRARYYNPDIKRFINQDIKGGDIGNSQSLNRYAYCEGNPVSMVDPFGLCGENANDQGQKSKYEKWHNLLGWGGYFWDGFDLINGALYAAEGDYVNAAISFACGIPAVGNVIAGVAKASKAVKAIKTAEKIAGACRTVGKIGNTAAGMKAVYDTYQTARRECKTTGGKIAYMAGTLLAGYAMGKAAKWGAEKVKNLASKAMPKLKTAVKEAAGKLVSRFNKGFGSSGSGHMSRNRGFAILPFGKSGSNTTRVFTSEDPLVGDVATQIEQSLPGRVIAVNRKVYKPDGNLLTDLDIELDTIVIQVKTGAGHKLVEQLFKSVDSTGKIAIGYVPKIRHSILKEATNSGFQVFRNMDDLIEFISQH